MYCIFQSQPNHCILVYSRHSLSLSPCFSFLNFIPNSLMGIALKKKKKKKKEKEKKKIINGKAGGSVSLTSHND